ncbi:MAG: ABC transporter permease [Rhodospirillaceae bacterium]|nr:ABC transporter permease [Rhodospirillaceae bacterium]
MIAYLGAMYMFILMPVIVLVVFSFQSSSVPAPPFDGPSLKWYKAALSDRQLTAALANSIIVGVVSAAVALALGLLAAYGMSRYRLRGSRLLQWFLVAPLMVSYLIIGLGLLIMMNALSLPKSLLTIIIGHVVINLPLCFAILYSQMGDHQSRYERAARDLGASEWKILIFVTVPVLAPALAAAFILSFTLSWDEFIIALLVSRFEVTLPVEIWSLLRSGLNPKTNAIGSFVFLVSISLVLVIEILLFRSRRPR